MATIPRPGSTPAPRATTGPTALPASPAPAAIPLAGAEPASLPAGPVPAQAPFPQALPAQAAAPTAAPAAKPAAKPEWSPHMWVGMDFFAWLRLIVRNGFAVHWTLIYVAVAITITSCFHTILRVLQDAIWGRQIQKTRLRKSPIFVLGHWRTGTTHLHDLLVLDERFTAPTTYECLSPNDFLVTEEIVTRFMWFLMPSRRPMDNMKMSWQRAQEDEFAMAMLGAHSPYLTIAFPNNRRKDAQYLDFAGVSPRRVRCWQSLLERFLKTITFRRDKRLVLKSPPHTARIRILQDMFPNAIFIHIVRDPYVVFPSTVNLWKSLYHHHGLQRPNNLNLREEVFDTFLRLYEALERDRPLVPPERFHEVKYEDLVRDPVGEMSKLYERLNLGGFDEYRPRLEAYLATLKGYETNKYNLAPEERAEITRRWAKVIERYGYAQTATVA
jgi:omega-hydroxy-beta-dihydromenaquinone-9 sulfotransferase